MKTFKIKESLKVLTRPPLWEKLKFFRQKENYTKWKLVYTQKTMLQMVIMWVNIKKIFLFNFFLKILFLWEWDSESINRREGERQTPHRAKSQGMIPGSWNHDLSRRQTLNWLNYPGPSLISFKKWLFKAKIIARYSVVHNVCPRKIYYYHNKKEKKKKMETQSYKVFIFM